MFKSLKRKLINKLLKLEDIKNWQADHGYCSDSGVWWSSADIYSAIIDHYAFKGIEKTEEEVKHLISKEDAVEFLDSVLESHIGTINDCLQWDIDEYLTDV